MVVRGRGTGLVSDTGSATEVGAIAASFAADSTVPPLVTELRSVAARMSGLALVLGAGLVPIVFLRSRGDDGALVTAILAGVALAVAAIPEGLATIVTGALALGARRMARRGAIVRRLPAIEALGSASVICTDKTGTLTTGRLTVTATEIIDGRDREFWLAALRCNDGTTGTGDPVDVALAAAARRAGASGPLGERVAERPFDVQTRSMATVHVEDGTPALTVKGAPEVVLQRCAPGPERDALAQAVGDLTGTGLRVLAVATATSTDLDADALRPLGLAGFADPLRPSAIDAIAECRRAGIRVVLVTGDHIATARSVAAAAGIDDGDVIAGSALAALPQDHRAELLRTAAVVARVDPLTKVELIDAHRATGAVVAMTGDGVNDAPALRHADIGVAVAGEAGTDVARDAAQLVVTNGDLGTLVAAVREGRRIYRNLRAVVGYLLTGNISEVLVVVATVVLIPELAVPLLPVQLLWVNLITDGLPALSLGVDRPAGDPLAEPPRPRGDHLLTARRLGALAGRAAAIATAVIASAFIGRRWGWDDEQVRTQLLLSLLAAHLLLAYTVRAQRWTFESGWWRNRILLAAVGGSLALQALAFGTAAGRAALALGALPPAGWVLAASAAVAAICVLSLPPTVPPPCCATRRTRPTAIGTSLLATWPPRPGCRSSTSDRASPSRRHKSAARTCTIRTAPSAWSRPHRRFSSAPRNTSETGSTSSGSGGHGRADGPDPRCDGVGSPHRRPLPGTDGGPPGDREPARRHRVEGSLRWDASPDVSCSYLAGAGWRLRRTVGEHRMVVAAGALLGRPGGAG